MYAVQLDDSFYVVLITFLFDLIYQFFRPYKRIDLSIFSLMPMNLNDGHVTKHTADIQQLIVVRAGGIYAQIAVRANTIVLVKGKRHGRQTRKIDTFH